MTGESSPAVLPLRSLPASETQPTAGSKWSDRVGSRTTKASVDCRGPRRASRGIDRWMSLNGTCECEASVGRTGRLTREKINWSQRGRRHSTGQSRKSRRATSSSCATTLLLAWRTWKLWRSSSAGNPTVETREPWKSSRSHARCRPNPCLREPSVERGARSLRRAWVVAFQSGAAAAQSLAGSTRIDGEWFLIHLLGAGKSKCRPH
jgi:hypothetical protein